MTDQPSPPKRKRGRPPVNEGGRKNTHLAFRVRDGIRNKLQASADASSCSLSEEVERRLEHSLDMALDPVKLSIIRMIVEQWRIIDLFAENLTVDETLTAYAKAASGAVEKIAEIQSDLDLKKLNTSEKIGEFFKSVQRDVKNYGESDPVRLNELLREGYLGANLFDDAVAPLNARLEGSAPVPVEPASAPVRHRKAKARV